MILAVHVLAAVPSLTSLYLSFEKGDVPGLKDFLDIVEAQCPNIKRYYISIPRPHPFDKIICSHMRRQKNLQEFRSYDVIFDGDTIFHLSRISTLTRLSLKRIPSESHWTVSSDSALVFPTLTHLEMGSSSPEMVAGLLSFTRLPVIEELGVEFHACPLKAAFKSCLATIRNTCSSSSLATINIRDERPLGYSSNTSIESDNRLTLDDLHPSMAFINLRDVHVNLEWSVDLTDSDLLVLASEWPHLHTLVINEHWGWRTTGGITFQGLVQLLQKCPSLVELCVALHTDSHVDLPPGFETGFLPPPCLRKLNLADSPIRSAAVSVLVDVFVKLGLPVQSYLAWDGWTMHTPGASWRKRAWNRVFDRVTGKCPRLAEDDGSPTDDTGSSD